MKCTTYVHTHSAWASETRARHWRWPVAIYWILFLCRSGQSVIDHHMKFVSFAATHHSKWVSAMWPFQIYVFQWFSHRHFGWHMIAKSTVSIAKSENDLRASCVRPCVNCTPVQKWVNNTQTPVSMPSRNTQEAIVENESEFAWKRARPRNMFH